jgi:hypothetical protein
MAPPMCLYSCCNNFAYPGAEICIDHKCSVDGCVYKKGTHPYFCSIHTSEIPEFPEFRINNDGNLMKIKLGFVPIPYNDEKSHMVRCHRSISSFHSHNYATFDELDKDGPPGLD